jgi:hypothetical protein
VLHPGGQLRLGSTVFRLGGGDPATLAAAAPPTQERLLPPEPREPTVARIATPTVRRRHGQRSAALLVGPTILTFAVIGLTAIALLVYFVAR